MDVLIVMFVKQSAQMTQYRGVQSFMKLRLGCIGHFDTVQCVDVCPVICIFKDPDNAEDETALLQKYVGLLGLRQGKRHPRLSMLV